VISVTSIALKMFTNKDMNICELNNDFIASKAIVTFEEENLDKSD